ncbi:hypothetical protein EVAR_30558_1 [Eumeta japonica]|uniref:Uncharacterized protein n=1 Tax=Eumeta variegata TaxID=151549 RepID=A0A4C1VQM7_EUMVA|nr:hypothetical protein EVAR_30558_1 [Eumeta japonica]
MGNETLTIGVANIVSQGREGAGGIKIFTAPRFLGIYYLFRRTVFATKYTGEFDIQFILDISERSWSTMQKIVPRNEIARVCRPQRKATPRLLPGTHQRLGMFIRV